MYIELAFISILDPTWFLYIILLEKVHIYQHIASGVIMLVNSIL